jgi:hypothetical protein
VLWDSYRVRVVVWCDTLAIEQKSHARDVLSLAVAEGVHELAESRGALDFEEDLVVVVRHLDVQVLALARIFGLLLNVGRAVVRHVGCVCVRARSWISVGVRCRRTKMSKRADWLAGVSWSRKRRDECGGKALPLYGAEGAMAGWAWKWFRVSEKIRVWCRRVRLSMRAVATRRR